MARRRSSVQRHLVVLIVLALAGLVALGVPTRAATPVAVVASGLVNPRGMAFDEAGALSVAIAGSPGDNAGVAIIADGCPRMVVSGLPAYRITFGGMTGVADVAFFAGQLNLLLSGGNIDGGGMANGLYRAGDDGQVSLVADVSSFIRDNPVAEKPRDYDTDGQPYALLPMGDAFWATEGNSNQVLRLDLDGAVSRIADLSAGHPIPTGIAPAPDGGAYVALFTHAPYEDGASRVVHVAPDGTMSDFWTGLTLVTALATGPDGSLYALEMATGIDPDDPASIVPGSGKVVRRTGPATAEDVVTGLDLPVAMEFGPDGALYVAGPAFGADNGEGTILRVDLSVGRPVTVPASMSAVTTCP